MPDSNQELHVRYHVQFVAVTRRIIEHLSTAFISTSRELIEEFVQVTIKRVLFIGFLECVPGFPRDALRCNLDDSCNHYEHVLLPLFFWLAHPHAIGMKLHVNGKAAGRLFDRVPFVNGPLFKHVRFEQMHVAPGVQYDSIANDLHVQLPRVVFTTDDCADMFSLLGKHAHPDSVRYTLVLDEHATAGGIDPGILGYIFEQGLDQNAHGAFYTPRHVASRMARVSLMNWLWQWLPGKVQEEITSIVKGIPELAPTGYKPGENVQAACAEKLEHVITHPGLVSRECAVVMKPVLMERLKAVKIIDPSCGAGAFLVAMFDEILRIIELCSPGTPSPVQIYDHAVSIINNNLFGIDILQGATDMASIRLWLAAAARCPDVATLKPFPEISRHVVKGNAVVGHLQRTLASTPSRKTSIATGQDAVHELVAAKESDVFEAIKLAFLDARGSDADPGVAAHVAAIEAKIRANPEAHVHVTLAPAEMDVVFTRLGIPFSFSGLYTSTARTRHVSPRASRANPVVLRCFEWMDPLDWHSAFPPGTLQAGFDILIGNPPYEGARKESTRDAALPAWNRLQRVFIDGLRDQQEYKMITGAWDLSLPFIERAFDVVNETGIISVILPRSFGTTRYSESLLEHVSTNHLMIQITRFHPRVSLFRRVDKDSGRVVDVGIQNIILTMRNRPGGDPRHTVVEYLTPDFDDRARLQPEVRMDYALRCHPFATTRFAGIPLKFLCCIVKGLQATANAEDSKLRGTFTQGDIVSDSRDARHPMPFITTRHVVPFKIIGNSWLEWGTGRVPEQLHRKRHDAFFEGEFIVTPRSAQQTPFALVNGNDRLVRLDDKLILFKRWCEWHFDSRSDLLGERSMRRTLLDVIDGREMQEMHRVARELAVLSQHVTCKALIGILSSEVFQRSMAPLRRSFGKFEAGQWREIMIPFFYPNEIRLIDAHVDAIMQATENVHEGMRAAGIDDEDVVKFIKQAWDIPLDHGPASGGIAPRNRMRVYKIAARPGEPPPPDRAFHELIWLGSATLPALVQRLAAINDLVIEAMNRPEVALFWNVVKRLPARAREGFDAFFELMSGDTKRIEDALHGFMVAIHDRKLERSRLDISDGGCSISHLAEFILAIKKRNVIGAIPDMFVDLIEWLGR
ncbi:MAG: hypothetical protein GYA24_13450 [Candidatus Lokiarchaeota archaeon]|nr:hypothetical protein [Candidatus Lokiarchaeota archaeon]